MVLCKCMALSLTDQQKADLEMVHAFKRYLYEKYEPVPRWVIYEKLLEFAIFVRENNGGHFKCQNYILFHEIIGSTGYEDFDCIDGFDFTGEYSIINFIEKLKKELVI